MIVTFGGHIIRPGSVNKLATGSSICFGVQYGLTAMFTLSSPVEHIVFCHFEICYLIFESFYFYGVSRRAKVKPETGWQTPGEISLQTRKNGTEKRDCGLELF